MDSVKFAIKNGPIDKIHPDSSVILGDTGSILENFGYVHRMDNRFGAADTKRPTLTTRREDLGFRWQPAFAATKV